MESLDQLTEGVAIQGLDELRDNLRKVSEDAQGKIMRSAIRKGANVIRDRAVENARGIDDPKTAESIAENIAVRMDGRHQRRTGEIKYRVGVLGGAKQYANTRDNVRRQRVGASYPTLGDKTNPGGDTFYWRFQELGTRHHAPKPFLRPAAEGADSQVLDAIRQSAFKAITRRIKRRQRLATRR